MGEARLAQDQQIQQRFLAGWSTTLNTNLMFATRARRGVENARLGLDATKAKGKGGKGEEDLPMSDEHRAEVERKEDDFVSVTEEAVGVMKNVRFAFSRSRRLFTYESANIEMDNRSLTRRNLCATSRILSPRSWSITKRPTRS